MHYITDLCQRLHGDWNNANSDVGDWHHLRHLSNLCQNVAEYQSESSGYPESAHPSRADHCHFRYTYFIPDRVGQLLWYGRIPTAMPIPFAPDFIRLDV